MTTATLAPAPPWRQAPATLPERFALDITWPDIRDGIGCSTHLCPVARALSRWLFEHGIRTTDVSVNRESAEIVLDWRLPSVRYWHTAGGFISSFDHCQRVEPTTVCFVRIPR